MPTSRVLSGIVVLCAPKAERYSSWELFTRAEGFLALTLPIKVALPYGLFDSVELIATPKGKAFFAREVHLLERPCALGQNLGAFNQACALAHFLRTTFRELPDYGGVFDLFQKALAHYARHPAAAELITFKALYKILSAEGFAVKEGWLEILSAPQRSQAQGLLRAAVEEPPEMSGASLLESLKSWAARELGTR